MNTQISPDTELKDICLEVKKLVGQGQLDECLRLASYAMGQYPDAPQPHNLFGIVMEKKGNHLSAMKHFRAAEALDPAYAPVKQNLITYGTFYASGKSAFSDEDCPTKKTSGMKVVYDERGIGHFVRKDK